MTTLTPIEYGELVATVAGVLDANVIARDGLGGAFDYWAALELACFRLGCASNSDLGNFLDGMIVDAVEAKWGALPDARLVVARGG